MGKRGDGFENGASSGCTDHQPGQSLRYPTRIRRIQRWLGISWRQDRAGETPEEAIKREIKEELATEIRVEQPLTTVEYDYPTFHLSMQCFLCKVERGNLTLLEHEAARWLSYDELDDVDWLPADRVVVGSLREYLSAYGN